MWCNCLVSVKIKFSGTMGWLQLRDGVQRGNSGWSSGLEIGYSGVGNSVCDENVEFLHPGVMLEASFPFADGSVAAWGRRICKMGSWRGAKATRVDEDHFPLLQFPDEIIEKVIGFLTNPVDRNSTSLVCTRLKAIEGESRETVLISNCYAIQPGTLKSRFPNAKSITIKGKPRIVDFSLIPHAEVWGAYATPWVDLLKEHYRPIRHLKMKRMTISDSDIKRFVSACGYSLERLEFEKCSGFSTTGLQYIAGACRNLVVLNLSEADILQGDAPYWMTSLVNTASSLRVLDLYLTEVEDVEQSVLERLAKQCHTLRLCDALKINHVLPVVTAACETVRHLGIGLSFQNGDSPNQIAEALGRCKELEGISAVWDPDEVSAMMLMPVAARLKTLDLTYALLEQPELTDLLGACVNLEDLQCTDVIRDRGLLEVGTCCKKLRSLVVQQDAAGFVTQNGLTAVAKGCFLLEKIIIYAADMTNEALETLATNCPNLSDIRICLVQKYDGSHPVCL
uniref:F-box domain-containing protein n=1 Tax=Physcomitrium patens TaxID=3218 RepID=A0A7I4FFC2_PHYPA